MKELSNRNPVEVKNETLNEIYSYLMQIQWRKEMQDIDHEKNSSGYVNTKVKDIWDADKKIKSLFEAVKIYCKLRSKDLNVIAVHFAEYHAMTELARKLRELIDQNNQPQANSKIKKEKTVKKTRTKIPQENKIRAELQKEIASKCPFCENTDVGHFEIHHIDNDPSNNEQMNLLLLCPLCHSKIHKEDFTEEEVINKKMELINKKHAIINNDKEAVNFNAEVNTAIVGNNNTIEITQIKKPLKLKYSPGCIGYDTRKANYVSHLIGRYNEYKEYEVGKGKVNYAIFQSHLKKQFKIGPTRTIYNLQIEKFDELVQYIQLRIDGTKLAKIKGKNYRNYSPFEEYQVK